MPHTSSRLVFDEQTSPLPEVVMLGTDAPRSATSQNLQRHTHPHTYEICYIARGRVEWWVAGEQDYEVGPDEIFITRPDELHGGVDAVLHPCKLYWLQLRLPARRSVTGLSRRESTALADSLAKLHRRQFTALPGLGQAFERLLAAFKAHDRHAPLAARGALAELLAIILRSHDIAASQPPHRDDRINDPNIRKALRWMQAHLTEDFRIDALAERVGLSVGHFHQRFRESVGYTPAEWRTRRRIQLAKQLLRTPDRSILDVAMKTGFSSSQYFATTFKRIVGITPRRYQQTPRSAPRQPPSTSTHH